MDQGQKPARFLLDRRTFLRSVSAAGGAALLVACQAPTPPQAGGSTASRNGTSTPGQVSKPATTAGAKQDEQWDQVLTAARAEGRVVVAGPPGTQYRDALRDGFQSKYPGIEVAFTGTEGSKLMPKLIAEREAGKYLLDIHIGGSTSPIRSLIPINALDPIEPALILPEVKDHSNWLQNRLWFMDKSGRYVLSFAGNGRPGTALIYNTDAVKDAGELSSWKNLLEPKWRGKIASGDPAVLGTMRGNLTSLAANPSLGLDYIRQLYAPEHGVRLSTDARMLLDWVAQGQYHVALGIGTIDSDNAREQGLPVADVYPQESQAELSPGFNSMTLLNKAPHPNAAKLYMNWVLSREGQIDYQRETVSPSWRMDVPRDGLKPQDVPDPAREYIVTQHEDYLPLRTQVEALVKELAGARTG